MAVAAPRRGADRDEHSVGFRDRRGQVGGEIKPLGLDVRRHQLIEPGFENRDFASAQRFDLAGILVHAGDLVAEIGKAGPGYQPHIARANHGDSHENNPYLMVNAEPEFVGVLEHFSAEGKPEKALNPGMSFV